MAVHWASHSLCEVAIFHVLIDGSAVSVTKCVRDLGVLVDCDLKFTEHISSVTSRGHARANLILKCFASSDHGTLLRSFTTYVRPLLEYASPVWSPSTKGAISKIESVQRRFTKRMPGCHRIVMKHVWLC